MIVSLHIRLQQSKASTDRTRRIIDVTNCCLCLGQKMGVRSVVVEGLPFSGKGVCINMIRTACKADVKCVTVRKHPLLAEVCSKPGQNALTFLFNMLFEYCKPVVDTDNGTGDAAVV